MRYNHIKSPSQLSNFLINLASDSIQHQNFISFINVGDGMGISTTTAARILDGQNKNQNGEENVLAWEQFPYTAFSKTYNTDAQVPDSAGTATAFACGVKTKQGTEILILF